MNPPDAMELVVVFAFMIFLAVIVAAAVLMCLCNARHDRRCEIAKLSDRVNRLELAMARGEGRQL